METKNKALLNEIQTLQEIVSAISSLCFRLTPDNVELNDSTIRSLYTQRDAVASELNNFTRLLDEYKN